ncbi:GTPase domain-containing protein, partial [Phytoactinopolyspora endophytica]|uniref:GTPase domain-containing protein n=1 Tax=Phytoactinopolyspora endophytica TaxID=1642495 RepID=UPI0013E9A08B
MVQPSGPGVYGALSAVRRLLGELEFPFESASAAAVRRQRDDLLTLLDLYLLPRMEQTDAPLLVTVGGPTGSGKSILVNAIVGEIVTAPGALRPTTRIPVLIHHPDDTQWFTSGERAGWFGSEYALIERLPDDRVPAGIALLDAPPLDPVASAIRVPAIESVTAADLWLFTTTASRYADAAPWTLLGTAAERRMSVVVVLNRVLGGAVNEIRSHLAGLLAARDLGNAPLLTVEETELDSAGMLPSSAAEPVTRWFVELAGDEDARAAVIAQTVDGAIDAMLRRIGAVLAEAEEDTFDDATRTALVSAMTDVRRA